MSQKAQKRKISSKNKDKDDKISSGLPVQDWPSLNQGGFVDENYINSQIAEVLKGLPREKRTLVFAFAEALKEPDLPAKAPELYANRERRSENPAAFIERVYAEFMEEGMPRAHLRRIDPKLYEALSNWLRKNELPEGVTLCKQVAHYDEVAERVLSAEPDAIDAISKLYSMAQRLHARAIK